MDDWRIERRDRCRTPGAARRRPIRPRLGLGSGLLADAFERCLRLAEEMAIHAIEVDAIDEEAKACYVKYGFVPLLDNPLHLYMPVATIKQAFGP